MAAASEVFLKERGERRKKQFKRTGWQAVVTLHAEYQLWFKEGERGRKKTEKDKIEIEGGERRSS